MCDMGEDTWDANGNTGRTLEEAGEEENGEGDGDCATAEREGEGEG